MLFPQMPEPQGLDDPAQEADSRGVAMGADVHGRRSHGIVAADLDCMPFMSHLFAAGPGRPGVDSVSVEAERG